MESHRFTSKVLARLFKDKTEIAIFFTAFLVEIAVGIYLIRTFGFTFVGGDAISHIYIARTVVDNGAYSGLQNLGTVWLPMFHLLVLPLVLVQPLYTSGFAGTIVNALATGGTCVILYRLVGGRGLGILASTLFMLNPFTLIYGATPMMEQTAIFFMVLAIYYFKIYWETDKLTEFIKCSLVLILGTLTRYELWVVAFLIILLFSLRELKNGQSYRIAYFHLPLWGIFAWLFWNMATFRDPLVFIHHPLSAQAQGSRASMPFAGSLSLTTNYALQQIFVVSGFLSFFAILSVMPLARKRLTAIIPALPLVSPIFFQLYSMVTYASLGYARYFYMGLPGLAILSTLFIRGLKKTTLKVIIIIVLFVAYFAVYPIQMTQNHSLTYLVESKEILAIYEMKEELDAIGQLGDEQILIGAGSQHSQILLTTGISPSQIFDAYDGSFYLKVMGEPWKYCFFVLLEKGMSPSDMKAMNDFYGGNYFVYRYYNDEAWQSEFFKHYKLVLETDHFLLYQLFEWEE